MADAGDAASFNSYCDAVDMLALRCARALQHARAVRPRSTTVSRSRRERRDSVDASVLAERAAWAERLEASPPETPEDAARELNDEKRFKKAGLGVRLSLIHI